MRIAEKIEMKVIELSSAQESKKETVNKDAFQLAQLYKSRKLFDEAIKWYKAAIERAGHKDEV